MSDRESQKQEKKIKSLVTAFDIVELIETEGPLKGVDIADRLDYSPSNVHYYLKTLSELGYLVRVDDGYQLGLRFLRLGGNSFASQDIYPILNKEANKLSIDTNESVQVAVEENGKGYYVHHASDLLEPTRSIGTDVFLHTTAAGKAILAELSSARVNEIIEVHGLPALTDHTLDERTALVEELQWIRERGIAFEIQEYSPQETGIAVPISPNGTVVGALELTIPPTRIPDPRQQAKKDRFPSKLVEKVTETARSIEQRLVD